MDQIARSIFKAIHEGKWLSIEYRNQEDEISKYWIAIHAINVKKRTLSVDSFHLTLHTTIKLNHIYRIHLVGSGGRGLILRYKPAACGGY